MTSYWMSSEEYQSWNDTPEEIYEERDESDDEYGDPGEVGEFEVALDIQLYPISDIIAISDIIEK